MQQDSAASQDSRAEVLKLHETVNVSDLVGRPFDKVAFNCYTLCKTVMHRAGHNMNDSQDDWIEKLAERSLHINHVKDTEFVRIDKPEPFCVVTFAIRPPYVTHTGVVLADCKHFIHVLPPSKGKRRGKDTCITKLKDRLWSRKIDGYYRYVGKNRP